MTAKYLLFCQLWESQDFDGKASYGGYTLHTTPQHALTVRRSFGLNTRSHPASETAPKPHGLPYLCAVGQAMRDAVVTAQAPVHSFGSPPLKLEEDPWLAGLNEPARIIGG